MEVEQKTNGFAQKRLDWDCWYTLDDISTQYFNELYFHHMILKSVLFDLILYVLSTIFQLCRNGSSWV